MDRADVTSGSGTRYRRDIEDLIAFLEVAAGTRATFVRRTCILFPGIGRATVRHVEEYAMRSGIDFVEALRRAEHIASLTPRTRDAVAGYLGFVDHLQEKALEGPAAVTNELITHEVTAAKTRSPKAGRELEDFVAAVERYDQAGPRRYASLPGPKRLRRLLGELRRRDFRTLPSLRGLRVRRFLSIAHVVLVLALIVGFGWDSSGVELVSADARIVDQPRAEGSRIITVEFEHEGRSHRASHAGDFEAAEGDTATVWFTSGDPATIWFSRWEHFVGPVIIGVVLLGWLGFALRIRSSLDPWG